MKRLLFICATIFVAISAYSIDVSVLLANQQQLERRLIWVTDSTIMFENEKTGNIRDFNAADVASFTIAKVAKYNVVDGRFVRESGSTIEEIQEYLKKNNMFQPTSYSAEKSFSFAPINETPGEVIGQAFQSTGAVALGIGFPATIFGIALIAYGYSDAGGSAIAKSRCATAGLALTPVGAGLTIISIPLIVHGKRVSQLNLNYTGNGAGVSVGL